MNLLGRAEFTSVELPDALEFSLVSDIGLIEQCAYVAVPCVFLGMFSKSGSTQVSLFFLLGCVISGAYGFASWIQGRETRLRIRNDGLIAEGNLRRLVKTNLTFATEDIRWLRWGSGGEDGPTGLYVGLGWTSACVLPDVSKDQVQMIRDRIVDRFPGFPLGDENGSGLFGGDELITLGLSKSPEKKSVFRS